MFDLTGLRATFALTAALALSGCASVDGFADHAVRTNIEVERTQNEILLLNIVRSSKRHPPVYTTLQSVTGNARPSAEMSLAIPFGPGAGANSLGLGLKGHDGPSVTAGPLDTQEFYQGIMTPIKPAIIDFYVQQGYTKSLLFNLFFNRIELKQGGKVVVFRNYPGDDKDLEPFQFLLERLIRLGLTTERASEDATVYGPLLTKTEADALGELASAAKAGLEVNQVTLCDMTADDWQGLVARGKTTITRSLRKKAARDKKPAVEMAAEEIEAKCKEDGFDKSTAASFVRTLFKNPPAIAYRVEKPGTETKARFAFDANQNYYKTIEKHAEKASFELRAQLSDLSAGPKSDALRITIALLAGNNAVKRKLKDFNDKKPIEIAIVPRSTDGVIYYLGELVRRAHDPDRTWNGSADVASGRFVVGYHYGLTSTPADDSPKVDFTKLEHQCQFKAGEENEGGKWYEEGKWNDANCVPVFWVDTHATDGFVSIDYEGKSYAVPSGTITNVRSERVSQVMGILAQLVALNKSAKDTPATSVLNVVNP